MFFALLNEGRFLSNLVIFSLKKLLKVFISLCSVISFIILRFLIFCRCTTSLMFHFIVDCNSTKIAVKLALCFLVLVTYLMCFGCDSMLQDFEFLYSNLQQVGSDLLENFRKCILGEISK